MVLSSEKPNYIEINIQLVFNFKCVSIKTHSFLLICWKYEEVVKLDIQNTALVEPKSAQRNIPSDIVLKIRKSRLSIFHISVKTSYVYF